jgi:hypothetical protein
VVRAVSWVSGGEMSRLLILTKKITDGIRSGDEKRFQEITNQFLVFPVTRSVGTSIPFAA